MRRRFFLPHSSHSLFTLNTKHAFSAGRPLKSQLEIKVHNQANGKVQVPCANRRSWWTGQEQKTPRHRPPPTPLRKRLSKHTNTQNNLRWSPLRVGIISLPILFPLSSKYMCRQFGWAFKTCPISPMQSSPRRKLNPRRLFQSDLAVWCSRAARKLRGVNCIREAIMIRCKAQVDEARRWARAKQRDPVATQNATQAHCYWDRSMYWIQWMHMRKHVAMLRCKWLMFCNVNRFAAWKRTRSSKFDLSFRDLSLLINFQFWLYLKLFQNSAQAV